MLQLRRAGVIIGDLPINIILLLTLRDIFSLVVNEECTCSLMVYDLILTLPLLLEEHILLFSCRFGVRD